MKPSLGTLYRKRMITFKGKEYEIFEFKDVVYGFYFENVENNKVFSIITGHNAGLFCHILSKEKNEGEDVVLLEDIDKKIAENDNRVDFETIRRKMISSAKKYYIRKDSDQLSSLSRNDLIDYLNSLNLNEKKENEKSISKVCSDLKQTIISQDEQIIQILSSLYKNKKVMESNLSIELKSKLKENILISGSKGTGKKEILKKISEYYNLPIIIEDASFLLDSNYTIENILEKLYSSANNDIDLAQKGILVIDGLDILNMPIRDTSDKISRLQAQRKLLKLLDGITFYFDDKTFNTKSLSIVALGDLASEKNMKCNEKITRDSFNGSQIMSDIIAKFSKIITMNELTKDDIKKILINSDLSPLNAYKKLFETMNIEFEYDNDFVDWFVEQFISLNSGINSLKILFDECISEAMVDVFSGKYSAIKMTSPTTEENKPYVLYKIDDKKERKGFFKKRDRKN